MHNIIAIDIGTTHCKAVIVNEHGRALQSFKSALVPIQNEEGQYEQDAEVIFQNVLQLLQQSLSEKTHEILCISFSAAMHSVLAVDKTGKPLTNAITWADTRSKIYAQDLKATPAGEEIYRQTGTPIHAMSPLCKIIWLRNEYKDVFARAYKFISIKEYIFFRLFGKYIVDEGIASATGLYDVYNSCWYAAALKAAGIDEEKLSTVVLATHIETAVLTGISKQLGLHQQLPFVVGGNDGCLANLGCGALQKDEAALTIGTSGAIRVAIQKPPVADLYGLFRYLLTDKIYVTGGAINNGGIALQWFAENFLQTQLSSSKDFDEILKLASKAPAGADNLIFLPYLLGERAPMWDEDARGIFYGLYISHKKEHLTRAVIEGISFSLLQILQLIEESTGNIIKVHTTGIVTRSEWWLQLFADIFGKTVVLNDNADASATGAAYIGMYATGMLSDLSEVKSFIQTSKAYTPVKKNHELYKKRFELYLTLYPKFKETAAGATK